jgi:hypothetical protein
MSRHMTVSRRSGVIVIGALLVVNAAVFWAGRSVGMNEVLANLEPPEHPPELQYSSTPNDSTSTLCIPFRQTATHSNLHCISKKWPSHRICDFSLFDAARTVTWLQLEGYLPAGLAFKGMCRRMLPPRGTEKSPPNESA